jgi:hypothetical protein
MPARKIGAMYTVVEDKGLKPLDQVLTVDTGDHTGWAFWRNVDVQEPAHYGQITLPRKPTAGKKNAMLGQLPPLSANTEMQLAYMWDQFSKIPAKLMTLGMGRPKDVVLESLEHWGTDEASLAAIRSGKLFKLAYLIGGYANIAQHWGAQVHLVKAREWKGQMDKDATKIRVRMAIGKEFGSTHVTDAIGMGLSLMGKL